MFDSCDELTVWRARNQKDEGKIKKKLLRGPVRTHRADRERIKSRTRFTGPWVVVCFKTNEK